MKIGIIGSGEMGKCLSLKFHQLGHHVSISNSRGPESLKDLAEQMEIKASSVEDIIKSNQVIIISIPQKNVANLPKELFGKLSSDVVVIETGNYYPTLRDGAIDSLMLSGIDSEWVQNELKFPVVKVFNAILATSLSDLGRRRSDKARIALAVSGDNSKSKELVFGLVDELGFDSFDIGMIGQSWKQQPGSPVYCRDINLEEMKKRAEEMGSSWDDMRDKILQKRAQDEALMRSDYPAYLKGLRSS